MRFRSQNIPLTHTDLKMEIKMSSKSILSELLTPIGEAKLYLSYKDFFVDPDKMITDDSHIHSCYEIYVNVTGDVSFLHSDNLYMIKSGDVIFSEPGEVHHCIYNSPSVHEHYCLWFELDENSVASEFLSKHKIDGYIRLDEGNKKRLLSLLSELDKSEDRFEKYVTFLEILKLMKENTFYDEKVSLPGKMQKILEYVNEKFPEIDSVNAIASEFHVSVPTVNRWFREYLHLSPGELIKAKKLSHAEKLIRGDFSVTEACFLSGFTDCSRFITLFKKNYGMTPLRYKKSNSYDKTEE